MGIKTKIIVRNLLVIAGVAFVFAGYFYNENRKDHSLRENAVYTQGRITSVVYSHKYSRGGVYFEYRVKGEWYNGRVTNYDSKDQPAFGGVPIRKGMDCLVAYDKTNPKIATIYQSMAR